MNNRSKLPFVIPRSMLPQITETFLLRSRKLKVLRQQNEAQDLQTSLNHKISESFIEIATLMDKIRNQICREYHEVELLRIQRAALEKELILKDLDIEAKQLSNQATEVAINNKKKLGNKPEEATVEIGLAQAYKMRCEGEKLKNEADNLHKLKMERLTEEEKEQKIQQIKTENKQADLDYKIKLKETVRGFGDIEDGD